MSDPSPAGEQLQTPRLSSPRPTEADIATIFAIHRDHETCLHNLSDTLTRLDEMGTVSPLGRPVAAVRVRILGRPRPRLRPATGFLSDQAIAP
ncbi:hypothetical protein [Streptomyces chartreusis]|uniref:hypothetical protein n=1 Tax=Streptomyces chartreusis TaxID=1969 RepID=UPI00364702B3